jgi:hypothetical protein
MIDSMQRALVKHSQVLTPVHDVDAAEIVRMRPTYNYLNGYLFHAVHFYWNGFTRAQVIVL